MRIRNYKSLTVLFAMVVALGACSTGSTHATSSEDGAPLDESAQASKTEPSSSWFELPQALAPDPEWTVPEGTMLAVRLIPTLSTKTHEVGDAFEATLAEPLAVDGHVVAPAGATVRGTVVEADKGGRVEGKARIAIQLTELTTASGEVVGISTDPVGRTAPATKKKDATKIGIGAGIGAAIGAVAGGGKGAAIGAASGGGAGTGVVLATRGAPAELPSETLLHFRLRHAVTISS